MESITAILERAQQRAEEMELPYQGALLPAEALALLREAPGGKTGGCALSGRMGLGRKNSGFG